MEFDIIVDQTEKKFIQTYKLSIIYWIKHDILIGKILLSIINIGCALLLFIALILFILKPHNYITPIIYFVWALFWFIITPVILKYIIYTKHKNELSSNVKMKFSQHEYIIYYPSREIKISYSRIKKLVVTDKFILLYPKLSTNRKKRRKQSTLFLPLYIFDKQQLNLLNEWINHDNS